MSWPRRQRPMLPGPARCLISRETGFQPGDDHFEQYGNCVYSRLYDTSGMCAGRNKAIDAEAIDSRILGLAEKISLTTTQDDSKAQALRKYLNQLRQRARALRGSGGEVLTSEADQEAAAQNTLSSVLLVMLELSHMPTTPTKGTDSVLSSHYVIPESLNNKLEGWPSSIKTQQDLDREYWQSIIQESPYQGDHWYIQGVSYEKDDESDYEDMKLDQAPKSAYRTVLEPGNLRQFSLTESDSAGDASGNQKKSTLQHLITLDMDLPKSIVKENQIIVSHSHISHNLVQLLRQLQYWDESCRVTSRALSTTINSGGTDQMGSSLFDIQDAPSLSTALNKAMSWTHSQTSNPLMDEADFVNEILLVLQRQPSVVFAVDSCNGYSAKIISRVVLSHLSPGALQMLIRPLLLGAEEIAELDDSVRRVCSPKFQVYGKVIQAFASAANSQLLMINNQISDLQQRYQRLRKGGDNRAASLIELRSALEDPLSKVNTLLMFLRQCPFYTFSENAQEHSCYYSTALLSDLYENVWRSELMGETRDVSLFQYLFQQSLKPFLTALERWLAGQAQDSDFDFLIRSASNMNIESKDFWTDGYHFLTEIEMENPKEHEGSNGTTAITSGSGVRNLVEASVRWITPTFIDNSTMRRIMYIGKAVRIIDVLLMREATIIPRPTGFASTVFSRIFLEPRGDSGDRSLLTNSLAERTVLDLEKKFPQYISILERLYSVPKAFDPILLDRDLTGQAAYPVSPTYDSNFRKCKDSHLIQTVANIDFKRRMESELSAAIQEKYHSVNATLKSLLVDKCRLMWHLRGMAEFYFMMQGEVMHAFGSSIFRKMQRRKPWNDSHVLRSTFSRIAARCNWGNVQFVKIRADQDDCFVDVCKDGDSAASQGINQKLDRHSGALSSSRIPFSALKTRHLEQIKFEYMLPWPLAGLIYPTERTRRMYSRITGLLFQVRIAKHAMENVSFLKIRLPHMRHQEKGSTHEDSRKILVEFRQFLRLRMRLICLVNDIWSYLMTTVLSVQIKRYHDQIDGQCDLDDMIRLGDGFIELCYERCFLKERTKPLHRSIMTLLDLILGFSSLFTSFLMELKALEDSIAAQSTAHGSHSPRSKELPHSSTNTGDGDTRLRLSRVSFEQKMRQQPNRRDRDAKYYCSDSDVSEYLENDSNDAEGRATNSSRSVTLAVGTPDPVDINIMSRGNIKTNTMIGSRDYHDHEDESGEEGEEENNIGFNTFDQPWNTRSKKQKMGEQNYQGARQALTRGQTSSKPLAGSAVSMPTPLNPPSPLSPNHDEDNTRRAHSKGGTRGQRRGGRSSFGARKRSRSCSRSQDQQLGHESTPCSGSVWHGYTFNEEYKTYGDQLETIEKEFERNREFLVKSLRIVVASNAARGMSIEGDGDERLRGGEGGSGYLDGLILALS